MSPGNPGRVLLLEFVTHERWVYNSRYFPFIKGIAEAQGFACRWLCVGATYSLQKTDDGSIYQYIDLSDDELEALRAQVEELRPSHVLFTFRISPRVLDALRSGDPEVSLLASTDHPVLPGATRLIDLIAARLEEAKAGRGQPGRRIEDGTVWHEGRTDWLAEWLGLLDAAPELPGHYLVDSAAPSYDVTLMNATAREYRPRLMLVGGLACDHGKRIADNPIYQALDCGSLEHATGCSFCTWFRGATSDPARPPLDAVESQLRGILASATARGRFHGVIDVYDTRLFRIIDEFFDLVIALNLPPTTFCFEPRLDRFLEVADRLEAALPKLEQAGHIIELHRMGGENLSEEENQRFNKSITLPQIDEAMSRAESLRREHPASFAYEPTLGYITCTPWTRLEAFSQMIDGAIERGFQPREGWLYAPLLLYRGSAITLLASRDEAIASEDFDDLCLLYEPSINQVAVESLVPWRFKDRRMKVAYALIVRFCAASLRDRFPDTVFREDALYGELLAGADDFEGFRRPDLFARVVVDAVAKAGNPEQAGLESDILKESSATYRAASAAATMPPRAHLYGDAGSGVDAERQFKLRRTLEWAAGALPDRPAELRVVDAREVVSPPAIRISLEFAGGRRYDIRLEPAPGDGLGEWETEHFRISHAPETPMALASERRHVTRLMTVFGRALAKRAPDLLPTAPAASSSGDGDGSTGPV